MVALVIVLLMFSMFVGLFLRYVLFLMCTVFLLASDRCMGDGWGWVHIYLSILWARFRQNKASTLKLLLFYVLSTVGMYGVFAFGSYCIIRKILFPLLVAFPN